MEWISRLISRFAHPPANPGDLAWDSHRWTRYRASIAAIDTLLRQVAVVFRATPEADDRKYQQLVDRPVDTHPRAYPFVRASQRQLTTAFNPAVLNAADTRVAASQTTSLTAHHDRSPKPGSSLRLDRSSQGS